jgi:polysaccharide pyruvyl transferase WcaK-like protein
MRVLIEPSSYHLQNAGDNAMLGTCLSRIENRFGNAKFDVATSSPDRLYRIATSAVPAVDYVAQRDSLIRHQPQTTSRLPKRLVNLVDRHLWRRLDAAWPQPRYRLDQQWAEQQPNFERICQTLSQYDLVVATGGGYLTDYHATQALRVLWTLRIAQACGVPTVLFGQGVGPISSGPLACFVAEVLSNATLIGLREGTYGCKQLEKWSIDPRRVEVTGDDAIELALHQSTESPHRGVGLNVRVASYAGVSSSQAASISSVVAEFADKLRVEVEPLLVTTNTGESDYEALGMLPSIEQSQGESDEIAALAFAARRCRLVVTGSYHAAVFALAQGVPVIGIAGSDYYLQKFEGLVGFYGAGCRLLRLQRDPSDTLPQM